MKQETIEDKEVKIQKAIKMLEKVMNIYGRGYQPKPGVQDTVGSILYAQCEQTINELKAK